MCLFQKNGAVLVTKHVDTSKQQAFYRVIGGSIEFYEMSEEGVRREIREELRSEIENLEFIGVKENIFVHNQLRGHEIVFLYKGDLTDKILYEQKHIRIIEPTYELEAVWVPVSEILSGKTPLYPDFDWKTILS